MTPCGLRSSRPQLLGHLVDELGAVHQRDPAPSFASPGGDRFADSLRRAGDDDDLAVEPAWMDHLATRQRAEHARAARRVLMSR